MTIKNLVDNQDSYFDINCYMSIHQSPWSDSNCLWAGYGNESTPADLMEKTISYMTIGHMPYTKCPAIIVEVK